MFEPIKEWARTKRREFLRNSIVTNGKILDELQRDRAAINYDDFPEECEALDTLIDNRQQRHKRLLAKFKEA